MVRIWEFLDEKFFTANHLYLFISCFYINHKWTELSILQRLSNSAQKGSQRGWFTLCKQKMSILARCEIFCIQNLACYVIKNCYTLLYQHKNIKTTPVSWLILKNIFNFYSYISNSIIYIYVRITLIICVYMVWVILSCLYMETW